MSNKNLKRLIGFRDTQEIVETLDRHAKEKGIARSDVLRMIVREKFRVAKQPERSHNNDVTL